MSKIESTDKTWNPIIGCSKISACCKNCYAEKMAGRLSNISSTHEDYKKVVNSVEYKLYYRGLQEWNRQTHFIPERLNLPLKWKKPTKIFVCLMGDLFHESVTFDDILRIWDIMCKNPRHIFQVLTKRSARMLEFYKWLANKAKASGLDSVPTQSSNILDYIGTPDHIWVGVTVEDQKAVEKRIPVLLSVPAKIRFVSFKPLLEQITLPQPLNINWAIIGGETGHNARIMPKNAVHSLINQLDNIPIFFKSWGGKRKKDNLVDGKPYISFPDEILDKYMEDINLMKSK